jgi:hypothetical protein
VFRKNLTENVIPILVGLKTRMEESHSPLLQQLMGFFQHLYKNHKDEVMQVLANNPRVAKEIEFDLKQHQLKHQRAQQEAQFELEEQQQQQAAIAAVGTPRGAAADAAEGVAFACTPGKGGHPGSRKPKSTRRRSSIGGRRRSSFGGGLGTGTPQLRRTSFGGVASTRKARTPNQAINAALGLEDDDEDLAKMRLDGHLATVDVSSPAAKPDRIKALAGGSGGDILLPSPMTAAQDNTPKRKPWGVTLEDAPATPMAEEEADDDEADENEEDENEENVSEKGNAKGRKGGRKAKKRSVAARKKAGSPAAVTPQMKQKRRSGRATRAR